MAISEFCDVKHDITFNKNGLVVQYKGVIALRGWWDIPNPLWHWKIQWKSHHHCQGKQKCTSHTLTTLQLVSAKAYTTVKEHSYYKNFIKPPSSCHQKQHALWPLKKDTSKGAQVDISKCKTTNCAQWKSCSTWPHESKEKRNTVG